MEKEINNIDLTTPEGQKDINFWAEEMKKCTADSYYFFSNYCLINGEKPKLTRDEYYNKLNLYNGIKQRS